MDDFSDVPSVCVNANYIAGCLEENAEIKATLAGDPGDRPSADRLRRWAQSDRDAAAMIRGLVGLIERNRDTRQEIS